MNDDRPTNLKDIKTTVGNWTSSRRNIRREEIVLCRLRLGHTRATHSFLLDHEPRPECAECDCYLTVRHLLIECPIYDDQRQQLSALCQQHGLTMALKSLLGDNYPDVTDAMFRFLQDSDLLKSI